LYQLCVGQTKRRARAGSVWWEHRFVKPFGYFWATAKVTKKKIKQIDILSKREESHFSYATHAPTPKGSIAPETEIIELKEQHFDYAQCPKKTKRTKKCNY